MTLDRTNRVIFDRIAPFYDRRFGPGCEAAHQHVLRGAAEAGMTPKTVLDVGCGTGRLLLAARERWPHATLAGVDSAPRMVEIARVQVPEADVRVARAERLPHAAASIDLVVSTTSLGHWTDQMAGLREIHRVLRPGGVCLIAEHPPPGRLAALACRLLPLLPLTRDPAAMAAMLAGAGLRVYDVRTTADGYVVSSATRVN